MSHKQSHYCTKFDAYSFQESKDITIILLSDITWAHRQRDLRFGKREPLNKIDGYITSGRGEVKFLFCHVIPRDQIMKGTCDLVKGTSSI